MPLTPYLKTFHYNNAWGELAIKEIHLILQCSVEHTKEMPEIGAYSALFCGVPTSTVWIQFMPNNSLLG